MSLSCPGRKAGSPICRRRAEARSGGPPSEGCRDSVILKGPVKAGALEWQKGASYREEFLVILFEFGAGFGATPGVGIGALPSIILRPGKEA